MSSSADTRKVVLITGCSQGGIGHSLSRKYAEANCIVYATARRVHAMAGLPEAGVRTLQLDVTNAEEIQSVVQTVISEQGRIDVLVNNAGICMCSPVLDQDLNEARRLFDTNVWGALALTQAVAPHMCRRRSGCVVNMGSITPLAHIPWHATYGAAKAALHHYSDTLRRELAPFNVNVSLVVAGFIQSEIVQKSIDTIGLKDDSLYKPRENYIAQTIELAHHLHATSTDVFAQGLVKKTLCANPPYAYYTARLSTAYWVMEFLPRSVVDWGITFGLDTYGEIRRGELPASKLIGFVLFLAAIVGLIAWATL
ncbi:hypothetical protein THASP1DRAFT_23859 [Thamnocephalis sphaerospora]|uniref:Oxidoreductase n=1 Tax=Thamnocephalis sphaerospora TaxID=78915 RepID=A0A4P9XRX6_9FUNG|nr:hypothetical protein THASP1DRAFT_23859 [Thamnocephalis sphaerospora]|eukprot:RKP08090.1 hypothetical protein THASP1DRAFT_23859 [Thamnocephalis sphaerospora]